MTLHRRMKSLRSAAQRPLAVAVVSSLLAGVVALALPAPHVHADEELVQQMQQQLAEQADTIISGGDVAADDAASGDTTSGEASSDGTSAGTSDEASSTDAVMSDDAAGQTAADGGQSADGQSSDAAAAADDAAADDDRDADADAQQVTLSRENLTVGTGYDAKEYLDAFQIKVTNYETSVGARPNYPFSNAFDGDWNNSYMAPGIDQTATFTIEFEQVEELSRILYRHFQNVSQNGFPTHFKILASETGAEGSYKEVAEYKIENSQRPNNAVTFTFSKAVRAKAIQFVTLASPGGVVASEMKFLRHDAVADEIDNLFSDEARTQVSAQYASTAALDALQKKVEEHPSKESMLGYIERARMILAGTWSVNSVFTRKTITAGEGADSKGFLKEYQAEVETYSTDNPGSSGNELEKAFDGKWDTRYRAAAGRAATVTMKLKQETKVHRIIYATGESSAYGYPTKLTIGFSDTGREGSFRDVSAAFTATNDKVIFTLSEPITAKYVRFNFGNEIWGGFSFRHCAAEIKILKFDQVEYDVANLFEDSDTQHTIKAEYNNEEWLTALQKRVDSHPNKEEFAKDMARAWAVYRGQVTDQNDRFDWPVHVIQKTGPDSERAVWVFFAEGYRSDEIEKFKADITERVQDILNMEPFRAMAPYMNIYAYCAESNESGYSTPTRSKDTFFKSFYNSANGNVNGGSNQDRCNKARQWITNNYLDEGGTIMHSTAIVNTTDYFGQGNGTSTASLSAGYKMVVHEGAHMFATLVDHYTANNVYRGDVGGTNQTANRDPETIRWREFLGHRKVSIENAGTIAANPTGDCLMNHYGTNIFCEICRESIFRKINSILPEDKRNPMYVAQPELTIVRTDEEKKEGTGTGTAADKTKSANTWDAGPVVDESNIESANGRQLQYRTVVSNYRKDNQQVTLKLKITGADGTVKVDETKTYDVHPNTELTVTNVSPKDVTGNGYKVEDLRMAGAMSLTLVTEPVTNLAAGDTIDAQVTYNGELMGTDATISYGTARISYKLVDESGKEIGDMPDMGDVELRMLTGTNNLPEVPTVYGYTYVNSNINEQEWVAQEGQTTDIVRYYRQTSAQVTRVLVDANGLEVSRKSERVASGTQITPAKSDFTVAEGYVIETPAAVTVESDDLTLTYTVRKGSDVTNAALNAAVKAHNTDGTDGFERPNRPMKIAVDGKKTDVNSYADFNASSGAAASYAEFDLGGTYELGNDGDEPFKDVIRMWRYWGDSRRYNATVIVVSEKGTFDEDDRTVLYNSDAADLFKFGSGTDQLYNETSDGLHVDLKESVRASKIRVYMNGSNKNQSNHIIEFELMGRKLDLTYNTELEQAIAELSKKVESGLYTTQSTVAARAAIENARRKLINGADVEATMALKTQLEAAEKKLRVKDTSDGSIEFLGGSLRYSDEVQSSLDGLRVGFGFTVPKGATVVWEKTGWQYGLTADVSSGFQSVEKYVAKNGEYVANLVLTNIPADRYDMILYTRARLTYVKDGEETTLDADVVNSRSVEGVADRIMASTGATADERALARTILAG